MAGLPVAFGKDKKADIKNSSVALELAPGFDYIINKWITIETSFVILNVGYSSVSGSALQGKTTSLGLMQIL